MELDRGQRQFLGDLIVLNLRRKINILPLYPFGCQGRGSNGRAASECLELCIDDITLVVNLKRGYKDHKLDTHLYL